MLEDDQRQTIDLLMDPATHGGADVERIDTHSAIVFLVGPRALKLKRAVRYDYLDFSSEPLRRAACEAEVQINRRTAPTLYRGVIPVTREAGGALALGGAGRPVDWVVEMVRFDQDALLDRLASRGALDLALMPPLAGAVAHLHQTAERRDDHGGVDGMEWVVDGNADYFSGPGTAVLARTATDALTSETRLELRRRAPLLEERRRDGYVRQCHGDLHLRNIVLLDGRPTLFDAIEFNDRIACVDVVYDTAFLLMDLWKRDLPRHANVLFNAYLARTGDLEGLPLLPLFLSCRAAVRAKTSATAAGLQPDEGRAAELARLAAEYVDLAARLLKPAEARLVAIGGFSGSGKSTLAMSLAPGFGTPPGALVLRSDEIRKSLAGVPLHQRLGPEGYTPGMNARVYRTLFERARRAVRGGRPVIVDAVFARPTDREAVEGVARAAGVPFAGLWLEGPPEALAERLERRRVDASDADAAVLRLQLTQETGPVSWHRIDAASSAAATLERARSVLDTALASSGG